MAISFGGLASGLDTNGIINQLIAIESRPLTLLSAQRSTLQGRMDAYKDLNTRLSGLENAAFELTKISNVVGRKATSSKPDALIATSSGDAAPGSYLIDILRLATASKTQTGSGAGQGNTLGGISDATDFSADTLATINADNRLRQDLSQGTFFVNGQQITISNGDLFSDVLTDIGTAIGGSASLVSTPGGLALELSSTSPITVANGTSNFLNLFKLDTATYDALADTLTSSDAVNAVRADLALDGSDGDTNLAQAVGSGTLTINGTSISYNGANDSLIDIVQRINNSNAGVRASLSDAGGGSLSLISQNSGPLAISIGDTGTLATALGLTAADAQTLGQSAQISVDGGAIQSFNKNSGIQASGLDGVTLDLREANPGNPATVTIAVDSSALTTKLKSFVDQFNSTLARINELTAFDAESNSKGILLADSSVSGIRSRLFEMVFSRVGGLNGSSSLGSLAELGLSTGPVGSSVGTTTELSLDTAKLQAALAADPTRIAQLLGAEETADGQPGVMEKFKSYLDGLSNATGVFNSRSKVIKTQIDGLSDRIDTLSQRLLVKQELLERQFVSLERTIARLQAQQSSLASLFQNQ